MLGGREGPVRAHLTMLCVPSSLRRCYSSWTIANTFCRRVLKSWTALLRASAHLKILITSREITGLHRRMRLSCSPTGAAVRDSTDTHTALLEFPCRSGCSSSALARCRRHVHGLKTIHPRWYRSAPVDYGPAISITVAKSGTLAEEQSRTWEDREYTGDGAATSRAASDFIKPAAVAEQRRASNPAQCVSPLALSLSTCRGRGAACARRP